MKNLVRLAAVAAVAMPLEALACDKMTMLVYQGYAANMHATVNGLPVVQSGNEGSLTGGAHMEHWLVAGDNVLELRVDPHPDGSGTKGMVEVLTACRGDMYETSGGNKGAIARIDIEGAGNDSQTFTMDAAPETTFADATAEGDAGLSDALDRLATAFRNRDLDTIVAMHRPMIGMAELMGMSRAEGMLRGMLGQMLQSGELVLHDGLDHAVSTDGRIHALTRGAEGDAPIAVTMKEDGGSSTFTTGIFWARIGGEWLVVSN